MNAPSHLGGIAYGLLAYVIWGFFPLYFRQLAGTSPLDILANRTAWAFAFVTLLLLLRQGWSRLSPLFAQPRHAIRLAIAALLLGSNWLGFLWAVEQHQVVASSLGYFLTPLVNVVLGLIVLHERLNGKARIAIGLAVLAVINELIALGSLPWISLFLATTFGIYGLLRKQVPVEALPGLWFETLVMLPLCAIYALWQGQHGHPVFTMTLQPATWWLIGSGILTALPLIAFAAATQRLPLATVGMLMYINPTMQFLTAVLLFDEPLKPARLLSFGLIWLGLAFFSGSMIKPRTQTAFEKSV